jgi:hypothetical protein
MVVIILKTISNTLKLREPVSNHKQVKVTVDADIAEAFKITCVDAGVSMAVELSRFMSEYGKVTKKRKTVVDDVSTRKKRRKQVEAIINKMGHIRDAEMCYHDNFPENLKTSIPFESTEESISIMGEVIDLLYAIYE